MKWNYKPDRDRFITRLAVDALAGGGASQLCLQVQEQKAIMVRKATKARLNTAMGGSRCVCLTLMRWPIRYRKRTQAKPKRWFGAAVQSVVTCMLSDSYLTKRHGLEELHLHRRVLSRFSNRLTQPPLTFSIRVWEVGGFRARVCEADAWLTMPQLPASTTPRSTRLRGRNIEKNK